MPGRRVAGPGVLWIALIRTIAKRLVNIVRGVAMLKNEIAACSSLLRHNGGLSHVSAEFADAFLAHCRWRHVPAGTGIQHAGDTAGTMTGVGRGVISITTSLSAADASMVHIGHPGVWFGFAPIFLGGSLPNSVVARTDCILATMTKAELEAILVSRPAWWRDVGVLAMVAINTATSIAGDLMIRDSARRCAAVLLQIADCRLADPHGAQPVEAPLSQEELAAMANLSRTSVSAILRDLEEEGLIKLGYRTVTIQHPALLRSRVNDG